jgi:peptide/nickel transport system substrate-binding protein
MSFRAIRSLIASGLCAALMLGAVPQPAAAAEFERLTIGLHLDLDTLDPTQNINTHQRSVYGHLYDGLVTYDRDGTIQPALAHRWERLDDLRWRFWLRDDVTFTNGEKVNAEAIRFSAELMQRKTSQAASFFSEFKAFEVVDEYTIDFVTGAPYAATLSLLAHYLHAVPPAYYQQVGPEGFAASPVGSGAYVLDRWQRGDRVVLRANPDWRLGTAQAAEVVFWVIPEAATRIAALISGEADMVAVVPALQANQIEAAGGVRIVASRSSTQPIWGGLVESREGLSDQRVRQAINLAVNKQALVDRLLRGYGRVASQPCPYQRECWNPAIEPYPHDPDRARALLAEAGVSDLKITLNFPTGVVPQGDLLAQAVAADLNRVGITAEIVQDEWSVFAGKLFDFANRQAALGDTFLMYYGAGSTLERIIATVLVSDRNWNWTHFNNPRVDELFAVAQSTSDTEAHRAAMYEIAQIVHDHAPWLFLYEPYSLWGVSDRIDWSPRLVDDLMFVQEMKPVR